MIELAIIERKTAELKESISESKLQGVQTKLQDVQLKLDITIVQKDCIRADMDMLQKRVITEGLLE